MAGRNGLQREVDGFAADERRVGGPADGAGKRGGVIERECDVFRLVGVGAERDLHSGTEGGAEEFCSGVNLLRGHAEARGVQLQTNAINR